MRNRKPVDPKRSEKAKPAWQKRMDCIKEQVKQEVAPVIEEQSKTVLQGEMVDEGDKLLKMKPKEARRLGYEDPTAMHCKVDPKTGKPQYVFRLCDDKHREVRGGMGSWTPLTHEFMKREGIELPNNPVPVHLQRKDDTRVFFMNMFWAYRPYDVNEAEREAISERSTRNVKRSEDMEQLAEAIKSEFGNQASLQVMDAFVKLRNENHGKRYY